jgi:rhodanese-related sulfurtransferase
MSENLPLEIGVEEAARVLSQNQEVMLIDCRERDEYNICRIQSSELIPLGQFTEHAPSRIPSKETPVLVHCHHGMRSLRAVEWLRRQGYSQAQSINGGIDAWSKLIDSSVPRY